MNLQFPKLNVTQASVTAFATLIITQVIAFVPAWSAEKTQLVSIAGLVISAVFLLVHAVHAVIDLVRELVNSKVTPEQLRAEALNYAKTVVASEIKQVNLNQLAHDAVSGHIDNIEKLADSLVQQSVDRIFAPFKAAQGTAFQGGLQATEGSAPETPEVTKVAAIVPPPPELVSSPPAATQTPFGSPTPVQS